METESTDGVPVGEENNNSNTESSSNNIDMPDAEMSTNQPEVHHTEVGVDEAQPDQLVQNEEL